MLGVLSAWLFVKAVVNAFGFYSDILADNNL